MSPCYWWGFIFSAHSIKLVQCRHFKRDWKIIEQVCVTRQGKEGTFFNEIKKNCMACGYLVKDKPPPFEGLCYDIQLTFRYIYI